MPKATPDIKPLPMEAVFLLPFLLKKVIWGKKVLMKEIEMADKPIRFSVEQVKALCGGEFPEQVLEGDETELQNTNWKEVDHFVFEDESLVPHNSEGQPLGQHIDIFFDGEREVSITREEEATLLEKLVVLCRENALEVVDALLKEPAVFPIPSSTTYERLHDDHDGTFQGRLQVLCGPDNDMYISTDKHHGPALRFRMPMIGGTMSPRVWTALRVLALAIEKDGKERPEPR